MVTRLCAIFVEFLKANPLAPLQSLAPRLNFFPTNINAMRSTPSTLKLPAKLVDELGGYGEIAIESINAHG